MTSHQSSTPSLLECIQVRNWQKAIDIIVDDRKAVYEHPKYHSNGRRAGILARTNNTYDNTRWLAIHELCKIATSPTSVRFSKDEISDDEEDDDDESNEDDVAEELDQIFDACELEEGTKIYEVTQFMIDVSHSLGPIRLASPRDDDENDLDTVEEQRGAIERNESRADGINGDDDNINDRREEEGESDETSRSHANDGETVVMHESILTWPDSMGKTPLHILCEHSCDSNMMKVILGSTKDATGNPRAPTALSLILAKDSRGSTPLHYLAYSRQCPFSSLKLMMDYCKPLANHNCDEFETSNDIGKLASHRIDPTLCTDDDGETPLHWALAGYVSSRRIKELTRYSVDAVTVKNKKGETPFDQFTANFVDPDWTDHDVCGYEVWENIHEYLRVIHDNKTNSTKKPRGKIPEELDIDDEGKGSSASHKNSEWLPLHFLAGSIYDFPPIFTDLALKYCSDDLCKADANGMLPLHLACERQSFVASTNIDNTTKACDNTTESLAMKILKKFKRASLTPVTFTKQLALHLAVQTQKPLSLIAALIRTYPRSLNIPDPVTKLWPYVLAGIKQGNNDVSNNESLSVSFALLRADPSVLHLVVKDKSVSNLTDREKSPWAKVRSNMNQESSTTAEESYMEHSSRRIRRLAIRDD